VHSLSLFELGDALPQLANFSDEFIIRFTSFVHDAALKIARIFRGVVRRFATKVIIFEL
jgi:hypothetical protein